MGDDYDTEEHFDDLYALMRRGQMENGALRMRTRIQTRSQNEFQQPQKMAPIAIRPSTPEGITRTKIVVYTQETTTPNKESRKRKRKAIPELIKRRLLFQQNYQCKLCQCMLPEDWEIDHVKPLWSGGKNTLNNLQVLCHVCHHTKTNNETIELYGLEGYFEEGA